MSRLSRQATAVTWALGAFALASSAARAEEVSTAQKVRETISQSLFGDVYADPSRWRPLTLGTFMGVTESLSHRAGHEPAALEYAKDDYAHHEAYADQNAKDHAALAAAVKAGRIKALVEEEA